jgi:hypothetical protein
VQVNPKDCPGLGDVATWGEVMDCRDPRFVEDDSEVVDYDSPEYTLSDLRGAAQDRQCDASAAMYALSELRRSLGQPTARVQKILTRLHTLLSEDCPEGVEAAALRSHQAWMQESGL